MAANYDLPDAVEKRVRYFDGQFLQDQDFVDEQNYQLDRERRHSRLLHSAGVADGLAVTAAAANQVSVAPGTAIDEDGRQLVLAQAATVDVPAEKFNNQQGIGLYIGYQETPADQETQGGGADYSRWLERPELVVLGSSEGWTGATPPVLLATLALDGTGRATIDPAARPYAGLRLPGPGTSADPPALHATAAGRVELTGPLTVDGNLGVGTATPDAMLHVDVASSGSPVRGLRIDVESFQTMPNAVASHFLLVRDVGAGGAHFAIRGDGQVGVGTAAPGAKLEVSGGGGQSVDLLVNGRLRSNSNDGGLWVSADRFIGGVSNQVGFYAGGSWRMLVSPSGNVGIGNGTAAPNAKLEVAGDGGTSVDLLVNGRLRSNSNDGGMWVSTDRFVGGAGNQIGFWNNNAWRLMVQPSGSVGIGTTSPDALLHVAVPSSGTPVRGLRIDVQSFVTGANSQASHFLLARDVGANATHFAIRGDGLVGVGTASPNAKLEVVGGGGGSVDLLVNGRLRSNSNDGGLWVSTDRFVGGVGNQIGFYSNNAWRLTVQPNGFVGIATTAPANDLEIGRYDAVNRYLALKVAGGNQFRSGIKFWTWQENYGYSLEFDERVATGNGFHFRTHNQAADGTTRLFLGWDGSVCVGCTASAGQKFHLQGGSTWLEGDLFVSGRLVFQQGANNWLQVISTPTVFGTGGFPGTGGPSDVRLKTALRPISHALETVRQLHGVRFRWGGEGLDHLTRGVADSVSAGPGASDEQHQQAVQAARQKAAGELSGDYLGLVAQEVEAVLPELVSEDEHGYKHIRYQQLIALLIEAVREQDAVVGALAGRVAALQVP